MPGGCWTERGPGPFARTRKTGTPGLLTGLTGAGLRGATANKNAGSVLELECSDHCAQDNSNVLEEDPDRPGPGLVGTAVR